MNNTRRGLVAACVLSAAVVFMSFCVWAREDVDLSAAVVISHTGELPDREHAAVVVLVEEIEKRTGIALPVATDWPEDKVVIVVSTTREASVGDYLPPKRFGDDLPEYRPEGYRLYVDSRRSGPPAVWVLGADPRGALYGVGALLRNLDWAEGRAALAANLDIAAAPRYPMRGHQLGYRALANSYDAWTPEQFDQYIRELALFGVNAIENIPFQDASRNPLMKYSRREMNRRMSEICDRYDMDYWVFAPADFDLNDAARRDEMLGNLEQLFRDCPRMDAVFFPGGDPGDNPPELALPYMADIAERLLPLHPDARIWLSLLGFDKAQVDYVFAYIDAEAPDWFGGLVADTSGPPILETRKRLPARYRFRLYPDITHNKLSQFEVSWWDPAYTVTLGREAVNPRPVEFAEIINWFAPCGDGFVTYSDGVHDDVNKIVWSMRGWDSDIAVRDILVEYARVFFGPEMAEDAADGILALEKNWQGPLATNGAVEGTLMMWRRLEEKAPHLAGDWRWQMNLLRAYYDAYTRRRLLYETALEDQANAMLADAPLRGAEKAMGDALDILKQADAHACCPDLLARIERLCEALFVSIGLQTSVEQYHAANGERGAVLDYVNYPLNNRWWLEDEFARIAALDPEDAQLARLHVLSTWENPGPGSYYDDIGNIAKSPRVRRRVARNTNPEARGIPTPTFWWWGDGVSERARLSWQWTMEWPEAVVYEGLDPEAQYVVRTTGYGQALLRMNGKRVTPTEDGVELGAFKIFPVPEACVKAGRLALTWDNPKDEDHLNWRHRSRVAEVWLLKNNE